MTIMVPQEVQYHNMIIRGAKVDDIAAEVQYEIDFNRRVPTLIEVFTKSLQQKRMAILPPLF